MNRGDALFSECVPLPYIIDIPIYTTMASVKVKFRPSTIPEKEGSIYYQIIHEREVKHIQTEYHIFAHEWIPKRSVISWDGTTARATLITSIRERVRWDVERINRIITLLDRKGLNYTVEDVISGFKNYEKECSLFNFMEKIIIRLKHSGKIRTAETYISTLNSFKTFRQGEDIMLDALTSELLEDYQLFLQRRGAIPNTTSFYMRILRAAYQRAVDDELIEQRNPFRRVYTGVDKTVKRALPLSVIKSIRSLDLCLSPPLDFARDMFLMSFYLRGMSFIDMAFLRKGDLKNGQIIYRRRKTNQLLTIAWTKEMQFLVDKYPENKTEYLLPIITSETGNEHSRYRAVGYNINRSLKKIAEKVGITIPLTMYCARHSWASAAKSKGIPLSVISEGMGHDSETTTQIYLASLDTSAVDQANSIILDSL